MRPELEQRLEAEFPGVFGPRGFEYEDGWFELVRGLTAEIRAILPEGAKLRVENAKEKFGTLRYYWSCEGISDGAHDEVYALVDSAEWKSARTCELCGRPGMTREGSWLRTLCKEHAEGRKPAESRRVEARELPSP